MKGATPKNGYHPQEPYTIEMKASVNKHQELQITGPGRVMYIYIMGKGWDNALVDDIALNEVLLQNLTCPDTEISTTFAFHAVSHRYDDIKTIKWNRLLHTINV